MKTYTNEQLIENIISLAKKLNKIPLKSDLDNSNTIDYRTYLRRFGNWNNTLIKAGFKLSELRINKKYNKDELIKILQDKYKELGRIPNSTEMKNPTYISYYLKFKSWENALREAKIIK